MYCVCVDNMILCCSSLWRVTHLRVVLLCQPVLFRYSLVGCIALKVSLAAQFSPFFFAKQSKRHMLYTLVFSLSCTRSRTAGATKLIATFAHVSALFLLLEQWMHMWCFGQALAIQRSHVSDLDSLSLGSILSWSDRANAQLLRCCVCM